MQSNGSSRNSGQSIGFLGSTSASVTSLLFSLILWLGTKVDYNLIHRFSIQSLSEDLADRFFCESIISIIINSHLWLSFPMAIEGVPKSMLSAQVVEVIKTLTFIYLRLRQSNLNSSTNPTRSTRFPPPRLLAPTICSSKLP